MEYHELIKALRGSKPSDVAAALIEALDTGDMNAVMDHLQDAGYGVIEDTEYDDGEEESGE